MKVNREHSKVEWVENRVPQGSILGPLLFIVFLNDLPDYLQNCRVHIYADNTAVSESARNIEELEAKMNSSLSHTSAWMKKNHLTVNCTKTKAMNFGTTHMLSIIRESSLNINLNGVEIDIVDEIKYMTLGLPSVHTSITSRARP